MGFLLDIPVEVVVELGRTRMTVRELSELQSQDIIPLDRLSGQPLDILAGGRRIGRGEVVFEGERMNMRIVELFGDSKGSAA
jgi:flagellar motor switch protein FliN/FliY